MTHPERDALVVVTSTYSDPGLGALQAPTLDAAALAEVLSDPAVGAFNVEVLADPSSQRLRMRVEDFFADRSPRHTLLLHFSCHGVKNAAGKLFLATTDTKRTRLASTAVPAEWVSSLMLASRAQRAVVLLDCCYAGAFERGMFARAGADAHVEESFQELQRTGRQRGRAVFTASSAIEYAFEGDRPVVDAVRPGPGKEAGSTAAPSLFTRSVVKGLRTGDADRDGDGEIGLSELAEYVCDELAELTPYQTPHLWIFGAHGGDLPIARTRRRLTRAAELPAELVTAVHSSSREQRLWAVDDLRTLLNGDDLGLALSARTALAELERDDSRRVSDSARRTLSAARPRVATSSLDLGTVVAGAPCQTALIPVEGPSIVRATMEVRTEPWLKAQYVAGGVELIADAPAPGHYEGSVVLQTATGEVPVNVSVVAVAERHRKQQGRPKASAPVGCVLGQPAPVPRRRPSVPGKPSPAGQLAQARLRSVPFFLASALMGLALVTPLLSGSYGWKLWLFQPGVWIWSQGIPLIWAGLVVSLATNVAVARRSLRGSALPFRPWAFRWYVCNTGMIMALTGFVFYVYSAGTDYWHPDVGSVALALGCAVQPWGTVVLWRSRNSQ